MIPKYSYDPIGVGGIVSRHGFDDVSNSWKEIDRKKSFKNMIYLFQ